MSQLVKYFLQCRLCIDHKRDPSISDDCPQDYVSKAVAETGSCFSIHDMSVARIRRALTDFLIMLV